MWWGRQWPLAVKYIHLSLFGYQALTGGTVYHTASYYRNVKQETVLPFQILVFFYLDFCKESIQVKIYIPKMYKYSPSLSLWHHYICCPCGPTLPSSDRTEGVPDFPALKPITLLPPAPSRYKFLTCSLSWLVFLRPRSSCTAATRFKSKM